MPTTINFTKSPNPFNLAYGPNIVSVYNIGDPTIEKYAVQIRESDYTTIVADVRQFPNISGYAHFDLQNILQNQVSSNPQLETIAKLATGEYELFAFTAGTGTDEDGVFNMTQLLPASGEYIAMNGRKPYYEIDWDYNEYIPLIASQSGPVGPSVVVSSKQKALTDRHIESVLGSEITDGKPNALVDTATVWKIKRELTDDYTLSFLNWWNTTDTTPDFYNGITRFYIFIYNGNTLLNAELLQNITGNGGGPDVSIGDEIEPSGEYKAISVQCGYSNPVTSGYPTATHIYVVATAAGDGAGITTAYISDWYRFDIDNGECNDFDNVQVSWLNSFGFRDYFDFQKRTDYTSNTRQDIYKQLNADWSGTSISIPQNSRGERVFNSSLEETYTINTRYLDDIESTYLKNLYMSPDVRVKLPNATDWVPVIVTSNQFTERTFRKDKLFQHTVTFRLANPQQIQHG